MSKRYNNAVTLRAINARPNCDQAALISVDIF